LQGFSIARSGEVVEDAAGVVWSVFRFDADGSGMTWARRQFCDRL